MHEVEFIPEWYPRLLRRRRIIIVQGWLTLLLVVALAMWLLLAQRNARAAEAAVTVLDIELAATDDALQKLNDLRELQRQWRQQDEIISRLGLHVETTRMLTMLSNIMPPEMAIQSLTMQVEERERPMTSLARARDVQNRRPSTERWMNVRMVGVVPTDIELANLLGRLDVVPFFDRVALTYSRDRVDRGHLMREFEVAFSVNLGPEGGTQ
jgi:hypothetical protein